MFYKWRIGSNKASGLNEGKNEMKAAKEINLSNITDQNMILAFAYRERDRSITDVRQFYNSVMEKAEFYKDHETQKLSLENFVDYFQKLQSEGVGRLVEGRHGKPTRFYWKYKASTLMDKLSGGKVELKEYQAPTLPRVIKPEPPKAPAPIIVKQENTVIVIPVRSDFILKLNLPTDFSARDVQTINAALLAVTK